MTDGDEPRKRGAVAATLRQARRLAILVIGVTVILIGLALIWLPGPFTMPFVLLGLVILATEFVWARTMLQKVKSTSKSVIDGAGKRLRRTGKKA